MGRSLGAPAGPLVVTGTARNTFDVEVPGLLHMKLLRSPHPHARIVDIDIRDALQVPGVHAVLTHHDAPDRLYSSARHEHPTEDPMDTRVLDNVVRFVGQRVAAVVADSEQEAEEGCRRVVVTYEELPYVIDPEEAMLPGAPVLHHKGPESGIFRAENNVCGEVHNTLGDMEQGYAEADVVHEETFRTQRVQHASLETHGCVAYFEPKEEGDGERITVRSSTQAPFLTRRALCALYDLGEDEVRVVAGRVGGGFGGKQEMLTEDIVVLAALKLRRPVKLEFTRPSSSTGPPPATPSRSPSRSVPRPTAPSPPCASASSPTPAPTATTDRRSGSTAWASPSPSTRRRTRRSRPTPSTPTPSRPAPSGATAWARSSSPSNR